MTIQYGKTHKSDETTYYVVATNYPRIKSSDNKKIGTYYQWAYTDKREPRGNGGFVKLNKDVCDVPERCSNDSLRFTTAEAAFVCAERLREFGILSSPYEGPEEWRIPDRGLPLAVVIIEHRSATIERIVKAV